MDYYRTYTQEEIEELRKQREHEEDQNNIKAYKYLIQLINKHYLKIYNEDMKLENIRPHYVVWVQNLKSIKNAIKNRSSTGIKHMHVINSDFTDNITSNTTTIGYECWIPRNIKQTQLKINYKIHVSTSCNNLLSYFGCHSMDNEETLYKAIKNYKTRHELMKRAYQPNHWSIVPMWDDICNPRHPKYVQMTENDHHRVQHNALNSIPMTTTSLLNTKQYQIPYNDQQKYNHHAFERVDPYQAKDGRYSFKLVPTLGNPPAYYKEFDVCGVTFEIKEIQFHAVENRNFYNKRTDSKTDAVSSNESSPLKNIKSTMNKVSNGTSMPNLMEKRYSNSGNSHEVTFNHTAIDSCSSVVNTPSIYSPDKNSSSGNHPHRIVASSPTKRNYMRPKTAPNESLIYKAFIDHSTLNAPNNTIDLNKYRARDSEGGIYSTGVRFNTRKIQRLFPHNPQVLQSSMHQPHEYVYTAVRNPYKQPIIAFSNDSTTEEMHHEEQPQSPTKASTNFGTSIHDSHMQHCSIESLPHVNYSKGNAHSIKTETSVDNGMNPPQPRIKYTIEVIASRKPVLLSDKQGLPFYVDDMESSDNSEKVPDPLVTFTLTTHVKYIAPPSPVHPNRTIMATTPTMPLPRDEIMCFHNGSKLCTDCLKHFDSEILPTNGEDLYVIGGKR